MQRHLSEVLAIVATIDPASVAPGAVSSDYVDLIKGKRILFVLQTGVLGTAATVDMKLQGRVGGGSPVDIPNATITQIVKASGDNKVVVYEVSAVAIENLALGYDSIRATVTVGTAASVVSLVALAGLIGYYPAADFDLADVAQIKQLV